MTNSKSAAPPSLAFPWVLVATQTSQRFSSQQYYSASQSRKFAICFQVRILFTMSSANLPVIVIVPGAFGTPQGFDKLLPYLTKAGYATHPGSYPSCNPSDPGNVSSHQDIAFLRNNVLLPLLNEHGKDVVVIAHSYGGVVAGGAATELGKGTRRAQGQSTGVIGLIYVAGNITLDGESLFTAVGCAYPPFIKVDKVQSTRENRHYNYRVLIILFPAISGTCCHRTSDGHFVQ